MFDPEVVEAAMASRSELVDPSELGRTLQEYEYRLPPIRLEQYAVDV